MNVIAGHFYITQGDWLIMYLGVDRRGSFVFYHIGQFVRDKNGDILHQDAAVQAMNLLIRLVLDKPVRKNALIFKERLSDYAEYQGVPPFDNYDVWYARSLLLQKDMDLPLLRDDTRAISAKELERGVVYREVPSNKFFMYLGRCRLRNNIRGFVWIGVTDLSYLHYFDRYVSSNMDRINTTVNNRKLLYHTGKVDVDSLISVIPEFRRYLRTINYEGR